MVVKKEDGFTLIELIVTLAIIGIVFSIYSSLYYSGYKSFTSTQKNVDIEQNVRYAMNYIVSLLEKGYDSIEIIDNGHGIKIDGTEIKLNEAKHVLYKDKNTGHELAVKIYGFNLDINKNVLRIQIIGQSDDKGSNRFSLSTDFYLRK
ncbi:MAG: PilW family protein [Thermoanaerobacteraceae bacterium]